MSQFRESHPFFLFTGRLIGALVLCAVGRFDEKILLPSDLQLQVFNIILFCSHMVSPTKGRGGGVGKFQMFYDQGGTGLWRGPAMPHNFLHMLGLQQL